MCECIVLNVICSKKKYLSSHRYTFSERSAPYYYYIHRKTYEKEFATQIPKWQIPKRKKKEMKAGLAGSVACTLQLHTSTSMAFEIIKKEVKFEQKSVSRRPDVGAYELIKLGVSTTNTLRPATRIYFFFMANEYYAKSTQVKTIALIK